MQLNDLVKGHISPIVRGETFSGQETMKSNQGEPTGSADGAPDSGVDPFERVIEYAVQ
jgi:hypothetical protein